MLSEKYRTIGISNTSVRIQRRRGTNNRIAIEPKNASTVGADDEIAVEVLTSGNGDANGGGIRPVGFAARAFPLLDAKIGETPVAATLAGEEEVEAAKLVRRYFLGDREASGSGG